ncbi:DUF4190 domain-containing protein [Nocardia takedensis]
MSQYPPGQYPPPPPGQYPPPPGGGYWQESPKSKGMAITALVLGLLALVGLLVLVGGFLFGILAVIFAIIALVKVRRGTGSGTGMAITGLILGLIGIVAATAISLLGWKIFQDTGGADFTECVNDANGDQAKIEQCERDWQDRIQDRFSVTLTPPPSP